MNSSLRYIDLFAGAGGLSEGFIHQGFSPVAHVEMDASASDTLRTRIAFHYLRENNKLKYYYDYLKRVFKRNELWEKVPKDLMLSVIDVEISKEKLDAIFNRIDRQVESKRVDVIIGGPPCQAYSLVGRSRDPNRMKGDKRNFLFRYYAEFLFRYKPKVFVFENVPGLLTADNKKYLQEMLELFIEVGYSANYKILNAEEFGVLQKRRRVIIVGYRGKIKFQFQKLNTIENNWQIKKDLFFDLPTLNPGQEMHIATYTEEINKYLQKTEIRTGLDFTTQHLARYHNDRDLEIYSIAIDKWIKEGKRLKYTDLPKRLRTHHNTYAFLDRFKVVNPYGHSHTLVAHIAKDGHYYIYPDPNQIRSISVREAARIQSFPDDYYFEGGRTAAFKQIGNAVPPLMAQALAKMIKELF